MWAKALLVGFAVASPAHHIDRPAFALTGPKWMQFADSNPANDLVTELYNPAGETVDATDALTAATATWSSAPGTSFRLQLGGTTTAGHAFDHKNVVSWVSNWPYPPTALANTTIFFDVNTDAILDADIEINANVPFTGAGAYDLQTVLTHEDGHVAGLAHSDDRSAVMYPTLAPGQQKRTLAPDDIKAITTLYPVLHCVPPKLRGKTLRKARRALAKADCRTGAVKRRFSRRVKKGHVVSQRPRAHTRHALGTRVALVVSKGVLK